MAKQRFWLVNSNGDVFTLCTESRYFKEVNKDGDGIRFKRVSANEACTWGIGHDQQVYTYLCSTDVPIRVVETIYENQRWAPWSGFSEKNLLRTDRSNWSNESGTVSRVREDFVLPSEYWQWEGDWVIDENFQGQITDRGGWQYAGDFPRQYSPAPKTLSMVRKRKWLRFRKYVAFGKWAKISVKDIDIEDNCFIDIAVGGFELPGQSPGFLSVWTLTISGKVYVRQNVSTNCPEGTNWLNIPTESLGLVNVSVGPTGLVWAVTWDGLVMVRLGVNRDNVYGSSWFEIPYLNDTTRMMQVAVGRNVVWALSREGKVWFRKGICGEHAWSNRQSAIGTSWVEMVGELCHVTVTPDDQVFGIGLNDRKPYFRTGVNKSDLGGKTWQLLSLQEDLGRLKHCSSSCNHSMDESDCISIENPFRGGSFRGTPISMSSIPEHYEDGDLRKVASAPVIPSGSPVMAAIATNSSNISCDIDIAPSADEEICDNEVFLDTDNHIPESAIIISPDIVMEEEVNNASNHDRSNQITDAKNNNGVVENETEGKKGSVSDEIMNFVTDIDENEPEDKINENVTVQPSTTAVNGIDVIQMPEIETTFGKESELNLFAEGQKTVDMISMIPAKSVTPSPPRASMNSTPTLELEITDMYMMTPAIPRQFWVWFSGMACAIDDTSTVKWLQPRRDSESSADSGVTKPGIASDLRSVILNKICQRNLQEIQKFEYIEQAIDKSSWMKKSAMKWYRYGYRANWEDVTVELEHHILEGTGGCITIHYCPRGKPVNMQVNLSDIVCINKLADPNLQSVFRIHTSETTTKNQPYLLMTSSESETDEWLATLLTANSREWKWKQTVESGSIWSTTSRGDVYTHQPSLSHTKLNQMFWGQIGGHLKKVETCSAGVTWALGYDYTPWVYTGGYGGGVFRATSTMSRNCQQQTDTRTIYTYENQKWYPVIGYTDQGFLTDCYDWSDSTGRQERNKESIKLPSSNWHWSCDWSVDFDAPGKVDKDGWQYSGNFNKPFHPQPGIRDRVRRRRWYRKCKLTAVGPWYSVGSTTLKDVSLQLPSVTSPTQQIVLWAVGTNGNVLCRIGVYINNPQGESWVNIPTDLPFTSISVGGNYLVYGVAIDGSVWYRPGVSPDCPTGTRWILVISPPPADNKLTYISAGETTVWALDTKGNLWFREDTKRLFPEGIRWVNVCNKVYRVSAGRNNQVMIIAASNFGKNKHGSGVIYNRTGVTADKPSGTGWEMVIGDGWQYVSVRGFVPKTIES